MRFERCLGEPPIVRESTNDWNGQDRAVDHTISYECNMEYGTVTSTCGVDGQWAVPTPSYCPLGPICCWADPYYNVDLITYDWDENHNLDTVVHYECINGRNVGYESVSIQSVCQYV